MADDSTSNAKRPATSVGKVDPDSKDPTPVTSELDIGEGSQTEVVDYAYLRPWKFNVFYRSVLWQMIMFGALSFVGPAMSDVRNIRSSSKHVG